MDFEDLFEADQGDSGEAQDFGSNDFLFTGMDPAEVQELRD